VDWAARSAIKGYNPALLMLADCYAQGLGVARDERVALRCFRRAAIRGDTRGAVGLARGLLRAAKDPRDDKASEARRWLQLSAASGDSEAACLLAWCWANGTGGDQDATEARRFFLQAATADEPSAEAQYQLAIRTGVNMGGVPALPAAEEGSAAGAIQVFDDGAERLLRLAAEGGHSDALLTLGSFLVKSGDDRASEGAVWLRKAAEAGNIGGMLQLGRCLAAGCGVDADEEEGALWMARAREAGAEVVAQTAPVHRGVCGGTRVDAALSRVFVRRLTWSGCAAPPAAAFSRRSACSPTRSSPWGQTTAGRWSSCLGGCASSSLQRSSCAIWPSSRTPRVCAGATYPANGSACARAWRAAAPATIGGWTSLCSSALTLSVGADRQIWRVVGCDGR